MKLSQIWYALTIFSVLTNLCQFLLYHKYISQFNINLTDDGYSICLHHMLNSDVLEKICVFIAALDPPENLISIDPL